MSETAEFFIVFFTGLILVVILGYVHITWLYLIQKRLIPLVSKYKENYDMLSLTVPDNPYNKSFIQLRHAVTLGFLSKKRTRRHIIDYFNIPAQEIAEQEELKEILDMLVWRYMMSQAIFSIIGIFFILLFSGAFT